MPSRLCPTLVQQRPLGRPPTLKVFGMAQGFVIRPSTGWPLKSTLRDLKVPISLLHSLEKPPSLSKLSLNFQSSFGSRPCSERAPPQPRGSRGWKDPEAEGLQAVLGFPGLCFSLPCTSRQLESRRNMRGIYNIRKSI